MALAAEEAAKKTAVAIAIEAAKLEDAKAKHPALVAQIQKLQKENERVKRVLASGHMKVKSMQSEILRFKRDSVTMKEKMEVIQHSIKQEKAVNYKEEAQLTELTRTSARNRQKAQKLKAAIDLLLASKKAEEDKARALQQARKAMETATKNAKTHLTKEQLAVKEEEETAKLAQLKKAEAASVPKKAVEKPVWSWT